MSDEDNDFGGSLVLDFRKLWRHMQPKNSRPKKELWHMALPNETPL